MIDPSELLFVVDEENKPLAPLPREVVHEKGYWHRCSEIIVVNSQSQILCQKRTLLKDSHPGMWEANFGGHLGPSDDFLENAVAEVNEELGLQKEKKDLIFFEIYKSDNEKEFQGVYFTKWDGDIGSLSLEEAEVEKVLWKDILELEQLFKSNDPQWVQHGYELRLLTRLKSGLS